jgi:hypothetical protein
MLHAPTAGTVGMASISGRVATGMIDGFSMTGMPGTATGATGQIMNKMSHNVARSAAVADKHDERYRHERRGGEERRSVTSHR